MAMSMCLRRICNSAVRLVPRANANSSLTVHRKMDLLHHPTFHPSCCTVGSGSGAGGLSLCRRGFLFSKWSSTAGSSHAKEKLESNPASISNPPRTAKYGDGGRESDAQTTIRGVEEKMEEEDDEEDAIIPKTDEKGQPLSNWSRMKIMMKTYGYVIIPVHWVIAPVWFGSFYYAIKMGIDIGPFLSAIGVSEHHIESLQNSRASTALMAYALYKIFTPLRYTVTLGATEMTIRRLRKMGYIKPHPPKEKSYRDSFKETVTEMRDKIKDRQDSSN